MEFSFVVSRFGFSAVDEIRFPDGKGGNVIRGAFGHMLRRVATPDVYRRMFEPSLAEGPSGFRVCPRPFVFRASHLDAQIIAPGQSFHFDMHVFLRDSSEVLKDVERAFQELAVEGFGAERGRANLQAVRSDSVTISLRPGADPVRRIVVHFETPTELKHAGAVTDQPDFAVLFARARDRVSTIARMYAGVELDLDYRAMGERAAAVKTRSWTLRRTEVQRRSSRTGQRHGIGGFIGKVEYEGELAEFVAILKAAEWTGVGRQTVWGKGAIRVLLQ
jgi:hypothetical protein